MNIITVKPTKPIKNLKGSPLSFSGITSRTITYKITPEMNEKNIKSNSKFKGKIISKIRPKIIPINAEVASKYLRDDFST